MTVCVINASEPAAAHLNGEYADFREEIIWEDAKWKSWGSIPAALKTEYFAYGGENFDRVYKYDNVILLTNNIPGSLIAFVKKLKSMGKTVCVGYHESFGDFMTKVGQASHDEWFTDLKALVSLADAYWNITPSASNVFLSLFRKPVLNVLHGVPLFEWDHGLIKPVEEREGIFIPTRNMNQWISRNHLAALAVADLAAHTLNTHVTYVTESTKIPEIVKSFERVQVLQGPLPYPEWLEVMSRHKLVFHYDCSHTLGQAVSDALLVDVPCIGGNSENNVEAQTAFHLRNLEQTIIAYYTEPEIHAPFKEKMTFGYLARHVEGSFNALRKHSDE